MQSPLSTLVLVAHLFLVAGIRHAQIGVAALVTDHATTPSHPVNLSTLASSEPVSSAQFNGCGNPPFVSGPLNLAILSWNCTPLVPTPVDALINGNLLLGSNCRRSALDDATSSNGNGERNSDIPGVPAHVGLSFYMKTVHHNGADGHWNFPGGLACTIGIGGGDRDITDIAVRSTLDVNGAHCGGGQAFGFTAILGSSDRDNAKDTRRTNAFIAVPHWDIQLELLKVPDSAVRCSNRSGQVRVTNVGNVAPPAGICIQTGISFFSGARNLSFNLGFIASSAPSLALGASMTFRITHYIPCGGMFNVNQCVNAFFALACPDACTAENYDQVTLLNLC